MKRYNKSTIQEAVRLRSEGQTYQEIRANLNLKIPKSTFHSWFKDVPLPKDYQSKIVKLNRDHLKKARLVAAEANKIKRKEFLDGLERKNLPIVELIQNQGTAKIALAMLCLGEASKYKTTGPFALGSSDPRIIIIFLTLLETCFDYDEQKIRCTVQCRADQDIEELQSYWQSITGIPRKSFYKARIDPRTIGKLTRRLDYKGVLRVDYFDTKVQLELESLSDLIYNQLELNRARSLNG